ncbi:accessory Sec-dependent serine-rich glycoprotein adhesin [Streptococcus lactarius]|uniref:accessory Sec-dependent serine-rich glycoprotein adhesin n=1 Tax=Streptococcus lactarius TaxID=684066 RepID=UPI0036205B20
MFFKRSKGDFRETERITRFKLIKSGKNWVRASISRLGLFRVMRGGVDEKIVVQYEASSHSMPADLVKGMVVLGALLERQRSLIQYLPRKMGWIRLLGLKSAHRPV